MPPPRRSLTVEPCEDRFLPSTTYDFGPPGFIPPARSDDGLGPGPRPAPDFGGWDGRFFAPDRFAIPIHGGFEPRPYGPPPDWAERGEPPGNAPATVGVARGPARGAVRGRADAPAGAEAVALAVPAEPSAAPSDGRPAAPPAERAPVVAGLLIPSIAAQLVAVRVGVALAAVTTGLGEAPIAAGPHTPPASDETPPPVPTETTRAGVPAVEVPDVPALAGFVPLDLAGLGAAAGNFLGRLAGLEVAWPDDMPRFEDYLWAAAAMLLAAGAVHASRSNCPGPQPRANRRPNSVLAAWEGTHAG